MQGITTNKDKTKVDVDMPASALKSLKDFQVAARVVGAECIGR